MLLTGWKEIANYLHCGVRTAQRCEHKGVPIIRRMPGSHAHVIAYSQHVDRWLKQSKDCVPVISKLQVEIEHTQQLLLNLSQEHRQLRLRLRRELASIRTKHPKRADISARSVQLRLQAMELQLAAAFTSCETAENALLIDRVQNARKAIEHAKQTVRNVRVNLDEPKHVPANSVVGLRDKLARIESLVSRLEARLQPQP